MNNAETLGLPILRMVNKANNTVSASVETVQSAMNDFRDYIHETGKNSIPLLKSLVFSLWERRKIYAPLVFTMFAYLVTFCTGKLTIDLANNPPGNGSWPMSFLTFFLLSANQTRDDCSYLEELLRFVSWTQLNDNTALTANQLGYTPLSNPLRKYATSPYSSSFFDSFSSIFYILYSFDKWFSNLCSLLLLLHHIVLFIRRLIDALGEFTCNGYKAFNISVLTGLGTPMAVMGVLADAFVSNSFSLKQFGSNSATALQELAGCTINNPFKTLKYR